ncbi:MAG: merR family transcriptional regulator [Nevskia sp.]|nr:merR family transcriptional regulator [Nevskia sp.]
MKIGELAQRSGLASSRIRFYESSGLIASVKRGTNGYREFLPQTVGILEIITSAQHAGFSLEEIRHLLPTPDMQNWRQDELLASLRRKVEEIELMQRRLKKTKARLLSVIDSIENKPEGLACAANAERLMASLR